MGASQSPAAQRAEAGVFISYSRTDAAFVEELRKALVARGYNVFLDREDIAAAEEWRPRLEQLILAADAVVFVATDASLASNVCAWEVERTLELSKRLIPLAHGPRTAPAPKALSDLNFVFSDDPGAGATRPHSPSDSAIAKLSAAIAVDIRWVREHSRLTALAQRWAESDESARTGRLLRSGEVEAAKSWMDLRPGPTAPAIPDVLVDFVSASDAYEQAERERLLTIIGLGFVKPAEQAVEQGRFDESLRLAAAGVVLSEDADNRLVPIRQRSMGASVVANRLRAVLQGHEALCGTLRLASSS